MATLASPPANMGGQVPYSSQIYQQSLATPVWDREFTTRREIRYKAIDNRIDPGTDRTILDAFLDMTGATNPPQYNYAALKSFLEKGKHFTLNGSNVHAEKNIIVDDRTDLTVRQNLDGTHFSRDWSSERYQLRPPPGEHDWHKRIHVYDLYARLRQPIPAPADCFVKSIVNHIRVLKLLRLKQRKSNHYLSGRPVNAERRVIYIAGLSSTIGLAIVSNTPPGQIDIVRDYLHRHVTNRAYFGAFSTSVGFTFEIHLPYFALRKYRNELTDSRGLRQSRPVPSMRHVFDPKERVYQAQISVLITGIDEWLWTAFCCVDTYFEQDSIIESLYDNNLDAPTGGQMTCDQPTWNPREYFLIIVANRIRQITQEWANIICEFERRLSAFDALFFDSESLNASLKDDKFLSRTKEYTWKSWNSFRAGELRLIFANLDERLLLKWQKWIISIEKDVEELKFFQRCILQKLAMFDSLRDGLVNASALSESQVATSQGQNITLLTWLTVMYLPPSLVTGMYGMAMVSSKASWVIYAGVVISTVILTGLGLIGLQRLNSSLRQRKE